MIRKATGLTQEDLAERLGARQGDIARIVVTVHGQEFELDLATPARNKPEATTSRN